MSTGGFNVINRLLLLNLGLLHQKGLKTLGLVFSKQSALYRDS